MLAVYGNTDAPGDPRLAASIDREIGAVRCVRAVGSIGAVRDVRESGRLATDDAEVGLDPAWRRRTDAERHDDGCGFRDAVAAAEIDGARTITYSSVGLEPSVDVLLWRMAPSIETLEEGAARLLRDGIRKTVHTGARAEFVIDSIEPPTED